MGYGDFRGYLRSPVWKAVKARYHGAHPRRCVYCSEGTHRVFHLTYARVGGDEVLADLAAMCDDCLMWGRIIERERPKVARLDSLRGEFLARPLQRQIACLRLTGRDGVAKTVHVRLGLAIRAKQPVTFNATAHHLRAAERVVADLLRELDDEDVMALLGAG